MLLIVNGAAPSFRQHDAYSIMRGYGRGGIKVIDTAAFAM